MHHVLCPAGKVAGAKWQGSKTTFDGELAEPEQGLAAAAHAVSLKAASAMQGQEQAEQQTLPSLPKIKWKKLAAAHLQKVQKSQLHYLRRACARVLLSHAKFGAIHSLCLACLEWCLLEPGIQQTIDVSSMCTPHGIVC